LYPKDDDFKALLVDEAVGAVEDVIAATVPSLKESDPEVPPSLPPSLPPSPPPSPPSPPLHPFFLHALSFSQGGMYEASPVSLYICIDM